jgi:hypothetical protein
MSNVHFLEFNYDGESRPGSAQTLRRQGYEGQASLRSSGDSVTALRGMLPHS